MTDGVGDQVGQRPLEEVGVGEDVAERLGHLDVDLVAADAEAGDRREDDLLDARRPHPHGERARLQAAHVEEVPDDV